MISESRSMYITAETEWKKIVTIKLQEICCSNRHRGQKNRHRGRIEIKQTEQVSNILPAFNAKNWLISSLVRK